MEIMNNEQTLEFIEDYRSHECLWDIRSKSYTNKTKRNDAYSDLAKKYNTTEKGVRNKIKSLRSYFFKEHQKLTAKKSGAGTDSNYETTWFAYTALMFILDSVTPRETKDSLHTDFANIGGTTENEEENDEASTSNVTSFEQPSVSTPDIQKNNRPNISGNINISERIGTKRNTSKRKKEDDDMKEEEAFAFLRTAATSIAGRDDCTIFGQMVAAEIRKLNPEIRSLPKIKYKISCSTFSYSK